jgi:molybdopterin-guanine dinucleotide biosynthesis protein A
VITGESHKKKKGKSEKYIFNPFEIAVCGRDSFEKNVFILNLAEQFNEEFQLGRANYPIERADRQAPADFVLDKINYLNYDFVLVTTRANSPFPKIVFIHPTDSPEDLQEYENIIAFVGARENYEALPENTPYFHFSKLKEIKKCILQCLHNRIKKIPVYGLVLTGGSSSRMKTDKAFLQYHEKPQSEHLYELLLPFCQRVFYSTREEQEKFSGENQNRITDKFIGIGPTGGILSAMTTYPEAAWLVLACDLPYLETEDIRCLLEKRNPFKHATAYKSSTEDFPEPLCTVYEPKSRIRLMQFLSLGYDCPRKFLINSEINLIEQVNRISLTNVNYPEEYQDALNYFKQKGKGNVLNF